MATTIVTKNGTGAPTDSDLVAGELAVDLTNGRLYTTDLDSGGTVIEIGLNPSGNVDVTGTVTADGLTVDGDGTLQSNASSSVPTLTLKDTDTSISVGQSLGRLSFSSADASPDAAGERAYVRGYLIDGTNYGVDIGAMASGGSPTKRLTVSGSGDISFYDTSANQALFWDASAESLGIGTTSPNNRIDAVEAQGTVANVLANGTYVAKFTGNTTYTTGASQGILIGGVDGSLRGVALVAEAQSALNDHDFIIAVSGTSATPTERMRIDSSGRLLINKTSSTGSLSLESQAPTGFSVGSGFYSDATQSTIEFQDTNTTANYKVRIGSETDDLLMFAGGSERMRIDASGGIRAATGSRFLAASTGEATPDYSFTSDGSMGMYRVPGSLCFSTGGTERIRIDASGNLLVGKTSANSSIAGVQILPEGDVGVTRDGSHALLLNRLTSDGDIAIFRKDGTTVGSIRTISGDSIGIGTGVAGLRFINSTNRIQPVDMSTGLNSDTLTSLGDTNKRFKDLYLSGGVYLGGTGAANKLDDYEEGTWTAAINYGTPTGTAATLSEDGGTYTKVGRLVTVNAEIDVSNTNGGSGDVYILGLPFTVADLLSPTGLEASGIIGYFTGFSSGVNSMTVGATDGGTYMGLYGLTSSTATAINTITAADMGTGELRLSLTYFTT